VCYFQCFLIILCSFSSVSSLLCVLFLVFPHVVACSVDHFIFFTDHFDRQDVLLTCTLNCKMVYKSFTNNFKYPFSSIIWLLEIYTYFNHLRLANKHN
jgi:hypothetical protein